jgi:Fe2+ transport system protein FeoA
VTLGELPIGGRGTVSRVEGPRPFRRRLLELGLTPGIEVEVLRVAPLGDPNEVLVRGYRLSLRKEDAGLVSIARSAQ